MSDGPKPKSVRVLDTPSRITEVLFGLIMALTFTGSISAATAREAEIRTMLFGAIGCNIAWGLIDAVVHVVTRLTERGRTLHVFRSVRKAKDPERAHRIIVNTLPPLLVPLLPPGAIEEIHAGMVRMGELPRRATVKASDLLGAVGVFLLVVASTFPVVIPFMLTSNATLALRISSGIAVVMLFLCGYGMGRYAAHRPWLTGLAMALVGSGLVILTVVLGG